MKKTEPARKGRPVDPDAAKKRKMPKREPAVDKRKQSRMADAPSGTGPRPGEAAPAFVLPAIGGGEVALADLRGHKAVAIFFFPHPGSHSCNQEAADFNNLYHEFKSRGVALLGICNDPPPRLERFVAELELKYPILYDLGGRVSACFGAYALKVHQGRSYRGLNRSTFLIDRKGVVVKAWNRVHVRGHAEHVVAALEQLSV